MSNVFMSRISLAWDGCLCSQFRLIGEIIVPYTPFLLYSNVCCLWSSSFISNPGSWYNLYPTQWTILVWFCSTVLLLTFPRVPSVWFELYDGLYISLWQDFSLFSKYYFNLHIFFVPFTTLAWSSLDSA